MRRPGNEAIGALRCAFGGGGRSAGVLMRCPFCGSSVEPGRDAAGQLVCPLCRNTGRVEAAWSQSPAPAPAAVPAAAPGFAPPPAPAPGGRAPGKSIAALAVGIAALVLFPLAIILGPVALVLGIQALRQLKRAPSTAGQGMAIAGIVLGGIGFLVGITVVLAAVVFVLVSNLGSAGAWAFEVDPSGEGGVLTVVDHPASAHWAGFELDGTASCRLPVGEVAFGDEIVCTTDGTVVLLDAADGTEVYRATV